MRIQGAKVLSDTFGTGVIMELSESTVTIDFNGVQKKFLYPSSFDKFLVAQDPAIQEIIQSAIASEAASKMRQQRLDKHHALLKAAQEKAEVGRSARKR